MQLALVHGGCRLGLMAALSVQSSQSNSSDLSHHAHQASAARDMSGLRTLSCSLSWLPSHHMQTRRLSSHLQLSSSGLRR